MSFVSFVVPSPSLTIFQRGPEQALACLDHVLAVAPSAGRLGAQGLTSGALDIARERLASSFVEGVEDDLAWQDQVAAVLDGSAAGSLIWLEMPELGAVGLATVKSIEPCPPIKSGPGRIVTATFRHASAEVLDLIFSQANIPSFSVCRSSSPLTTDPSPLTFGVTAAHPFWSVDRESFVPTGELQPQERVIGIDGQHFRLTSITPRAGPQPVYNLEVALDHVYYVGEGGVLVHNFYLAGKLQEAAHSGEQYASTLLDALKSTRKSTRNIDSSRNLAAAVVETERVGTRVIAHANISKHLHSEERLIEHLEALIAVYGRDNVKVHEVASERMFCGLDRANCVGKMKDFAKSHGMGDFPASNITDEIGSTTPWWNR